MYLTFPEIDCLELSRHHLLVLIFESRLFVQPLKHEKVNIHRKITGF